jgi:hypothetical protein
VGGGKLYWTYRTDEYGSDPAWEASKAFEALYAQVGKPVGEPEQINRSVWIRSFEKGTLVLNVAPVPVQTQWKDKSLRLKAHQAARVSLTE